MDTVKRFTHCKVEFDGAPCDELLEGVATQIEQQLSRNRKGTISAEAIMLFLVNKVEEQAEKRGLIHREG